MTADLDKVRKLHDWNRRLMSIGGCWPLEPSYVKFYIGYAYFATQMIFITIDLINVLGDMDLMLANLAESTEQLIVGIKMLVVRHSAPLLKVVQQAKDGAREENYRDEKEKYLYLEYTTIGMTFYRVFGWLSLSPELTYFFVPMENIVRAELGLLFFSLAALFNETMQYIFPYRTLIHFNVTDMRTYALLYASQFPLVYFYFFHTISICFLCTLIVHVAGELSILAYRIKNMNNADSSDDCSIIESAFRDVTIKHLQIIETAEKINDIFNLILLEELVITTGIIGLSAYSVLVKDFKASLFEFITFIIYSASMIGVILIYCILGDFLTRESMNVEAAFYECRWYTMPTKYKKHMMICMIRAHRPLQLTAGGFYIFELSGFSSVLKTSMAYISMLRTMA